MQMLDNSIRLSGGLLHWYEAGDGDLPVILLHGGGGTGRAWLHQLEFLSDRGYRVLAPDMPGFGRSDWFDGVAHVEDITPTLFEWMDKLGVSRAILGGNSMGGRVAMSMASAHPNRVVALIILDSVGVSLSDVAVTNPLSLPPSGYMQGLVADVNRYKERTPYRTLDDARELNRGRASFARYLKEGEIRPDPALDVGRLDMPVLLVWGREDQIVPLAYGRALDSELAKSELLVIDHCGHLPHIEEPDITNHAILEFLQRLPRR